MVNKIKNKKTAINQTGAMLILVIVFTGIFVLILSAMLGLVLLQQKLSNQEVAEIQALHIAEAGINYYRWHLAHDPNDYTDGTGQPGPYEHSYSDPTTGEIGTFSLEIDPPPEGSTVVTIRSTGWVNKYPNIKKRIEAKYGKPSLARFSFLTNSDVWFGSNEHIAGEMHSNGGIRMDGTNDSLVTSTKETYTCTDSHGCSSSGETKPGVWGSGPNSDLWKYPVPEIDFNSITLDLATLKQQAQSNGHYYPHQNYGYHIIFKSDGTYDLYLATQLYPSLYQVNDNFSGCTYKQERILNEALIGTYNAPSNGVIFVEDNVWVEGTVKGRFTLAVARFPDNPATNASIFINNNINYSARDGTNALGLIAQKNVIVPRHAPSTLTIDAVMLAQKGRVYRPYYCWWGNLITDSIEIYGGIITNKIWTWSWVDSNDNTIDGYTNTTTIYDNNIKFSPPPHFPTDNEYQLISWEELPE